MAQVPTLPDGTPVAVELFSTSILSNHKIRAKHDRFVSVLTVQRIPFVVHDLASDPGAKSRWRRKALIDPSFPGLLVHNEWRGTYEEFHEAVEFGELDLFLRIDKDRLAREAAAAGLEETTTEGQPSTVTQASGVNGVDFIPPPLAPEGSGARPELDADETLLSLGLSGVKLSDADADQLLAEVDTPRKPAAPNEPLYTVAGDRIAARTYIPSANAGIKPLRLPRMPSAPATISTTSSLPRAPSAKYSASHNTSAALAAEAKAIIKPRRSQGTRVASVVQDGADLPTALANVRDHVDQHVAGHETADDLFASLGLTELTMTDAEAEAFLETGEIPETLVSPPHDKRWLSDGDKARHEAAARDLAGRKRDLGFGVSPAAQTSRRLSHSARNYMDRSASASNVSAMTPTLPMTAEACEAESPAQSASPLSSPAEAADNTAIDLDELPAEEKNQKVLAPGQGANDKFAHTFNSGDHELKEAPTSYTEKVVPPLPYQVPPETDHESSCFVEASSSVKESSSDLIGPQGDAVPAAQQSLPGAIGSGEPPESTLSEAAVSTAPDSHRSSRQLQPPVIVHEQAPSVFAAKRAPGGNSLESSLNSPPLPTSCGAGSSIAGITAADAVDKTTKDAAIPDGYEETASSSKLALSPEHTVPCSAPSPALSQQITPVLPAQAPPALSPPGNVPETAPDQGPAETSTSAPSPVAIAALESSPKSSSANFDATPSSPNSLRSGIRGPSYGSRSTSKQSLIDLFPPSKKRSASGGSSPLAPTTPGDTSHGQVVATPTLLPSPPASSALTSSVSQEASLSSPQPPSVAGQTLASSVASRPSEPASAEAPVASKGHQRTLTEILQMADDVIAGNGGDEGLGLDSALVDML